MKKFIEDIEKLAESLEKSDETPGIISPAINLLYTYAEAGINSLRNSGHFNVNVHRVQEELIPLFFHFESGGDGFIISTSDKYTFFMQSNENKVFIYGTGRQGNNRALKSDRKMSQLFNLDYQEKNGEVVFYDSTGKELSPGEIVLLTLNWSLN